MVTLIDIEPGMVVAGRYVVSTVDRRWLLDNPEVGAVCTGLDAILDEPVLIHVADADGSTDVLEAARRVSILGDQRIAPTLDVGHSNGLDYIVSKRIAATPLGQILPKSPLPVDAACALIGEIGSVLVTAARRGLFHMFLHPGVIGLTSKGGVLVSGIGIDAALGLGTEVISPEDYTPTKASRQDALDLIRLFYAALTGYWPADEQLDGIPAAERENSRIARAKSLNPEISDELDDFVSGIITGSDPGPGSVAEILGYIDEWDAGLLRYVNRAPVAENDTLFEQSPRSFDEATSLPAPRSKTIGGSGHGGTTASEDQVQAALVRIGITRPGTRGLAAGVSGNTTGRYADRMQMREASSFPIAKEQLDNAAQDWDEWEPEQTYSQYSTYAEREYDENVTTPIMNRDDVESDPTTQAIDIVAEDDEDDNDTRVIMDDEDDGSWFLGGMFETNEQQREHQLREYERERRIARAKEEEARRRLAALEESSAARQEEANAAAPPKQMRRLSPDSVAGEAADSNADTGSSAGTGSSIGTGQTSNSHQPKNRTAAGVPRQQQSERPRAERDATSNRVAGDQRSASAGRGAAAAGAGVAAAAAGTAGAGAAAGASRSGASGSAGSGAAAATAAAPSTASAAGSGSGGSSNGDSDRDPAATRKPFLWLVLGLVVLAAIVIGIVAINLNSDGGDSGPVAETSEPTESGDDAGQEKEEPKATPPKIASVEALDPEGDDEEHDDEAELVIPDTKGGWNTDRYNSAEFGNLKSGVGLLFELEDETTVKEVKVSSESSGGKFEILSGDDPQDAKKVGEGSFDSDGGATVKLDDDVETDKLILWITELPSASGGYKATINTVEFK
ncbi:MAG: virulence factor MviN [Brevibacterium sp.]